MSYSYKPDPLQLAEFDIGGVLYHANYFKLFERGRESMLRDGGMPYPDLVKDSRHLVVAETNVSFLQPVYFGDELTLKLHTSDLRRAAVKIHYQLFKKDQLGEILVTKAWTKQALVEKSDAGLALIPFPEDLCALFKDLLAPTSDS